VTRSRILIMKVWFGNDSVILVSVSRVINNTDFFYLYRSTDQGLTFDSITVGITNHVAVEHLAYTGNIFFAFFDNYLFRTMDNGGTWHQVQVPDTAIYIMGVTKSEGALIFSSCSWECNGNNLFISFDNGNSWTEIRGDLPKSNAWIAPLLNNEERILPEFMRMVLWYNDFALTGTKEVIPKKNETLKVSPNPAFDKITVTLTLEKKETGTSESLILPTELSMIAG